MLNLADLQRRMVRLTADRDHAERRVADERAALAAAEQRTADAEEAQALVQQVAEAVQEAAHRQVASVVSRCLEAVFGDGAYEFKIQFERKRGKTEARLLFVRDGREVEPVDAAGGGAIDVAAFALRVACLMLARPARRRFLALDEPWKHLSAEYRPAVRDLVESLAEEMGVQFLIITHSDEFRIGKVVEINP